MAASWLACHLPEGPLVSLARTGGDLWYRLTPTRAAQARRNLRRVVEHLAATGSWTRLRARRGRRRTRPRAPRPPRVPPRRHLLPRDDADAGPPARRCRTSGDDRDARRRGRGVRPRRRGHLRRPALRCPRAAGPVPGQPRRWGRGPDGDDRRPGAPGLVHQDARRGRHPDRRPARGAPRADRGPARRFERRARRRSRHHRWRDAHHALRGSGLVAPRAGDAGGRDRAHRPTSSGVRRIGTGRYAGRVAPVGIPAEGSRRDRVTAGTTAIAAAFEDVIAVAPEQWWAVFFPIWPDLEGKRQPCAGAAQDGATA